jgi:hypothetical protein
MFNAIVEVMGNGMARLAVISFAPIATRCSGLSTLNRRHHRDFFSCCPVT